MTGPEHYQAAERVFDGLYDEATPEGRAHDMKILAEAQVHATLALVAATALRTGDGSMPSSEHGAWHRAAGTAKPIQGAKG
jgi:hypothetical protein